MEKGTREMNNEPVAIRYDFDGYGYQYMDSGSGSDWQTRVEGEFLYTHPSKDLTDEEIEELWYDPRFIGDPVAFGKAVLRETQNITLQTDEEICKKCDALTERAILRKAQEK